MALATYADLQTSVITWSKRPDLAAQIPDFITLAETRMSRDLKFLQLEKTYPFFTAAGTASYSLPADAVGLSRVYRTDTNGLQIPLEEYDPSLQWTYQADYPQYYSAESGQIVIYPTPNSTQPLSLVYRGKLPPLASNSTNFVLTDTPNIYLFGTLVELADYTKSDDLAKWEGRYGQAVKTANKGNNYKSKALLATEFGRRRGYNIYSGY